MASAIYEKTFSNVDTALATYITDVATNVIAAITPVVTTLLLIYITLWGWMVITGKGGEIVTDGFNRIIKITIIVTLAINLGYYNVFVVDLLSNLPDRLAELATTTPSAISTANFLDSTLDDIWAIGNVFMEKAEANSTLGFIADIPLTLAALAVWFFGGLLTAFAAFLMVLSKMALSVLLAFGPIFILLTLFESTKRFFDTWFGQCINFIVIIMLVGGILRLIINILNSYTSGYLAVVNTANAEVTGALPAVILSGIALLVLRQVMPIASAIGGGMALSTLGTGRGVGQAFNNWDSRRTQSKTFQNKATTSGQQIAAGARKTYSAAKSATAKLKRGNSITQN